jgi:hypothetical protein
MAAEGNPNVMDQILNGSIGVIGLIPGEANDYSGINNSDPDAYWVPLHKPVLTEGQVFHLVDVRTWNSIGSWGNSTNCENIPLRLTYCDLDSTAPAVHSSQTTALRDIRSITTRTARRWLTDFLVNHPGECPGRFYSLP